MSDQPDCAWVATRKARVLPNRHTDTCPGDGCTGCEPCRRAHCPLCHREHLDAQHPATCPGCVAHTRDDLAAVVDLYARLEDDPANGSVLLLGPVSDGSGELAYALTTGDYEDLAADSLAADPPLAVLATWERCWRDWLGQDDPATRATVTGCAGYLDQHLSMMAQATQRVDSDGDLEFAPEFVEFARDIRGARSRLEDVLGEGVRSTRGAPCFDCGTALRQVFRAPDPCDHLDQVVQDAVDAARRPVLVCEDPPCRACLLRVKAAEAEVRLAIRTALAGHWCDQGGRRDVWRCPGCGGEYDQQRYRRARAHAMADAQPWRTAPEIQALLGIRSRTLHEWYARGQLDRLTDARGRPLYHLQQARQRAMRGGLIAS